MKQQPFIIGIAGGSGSGKSTAVLNITGVLPSDEFSLLAHDSYYIDQSHLALEERAKVNFDHPSALETELLIEHLKPLKQGNSIEIPQYEFTTHSRTKKLRILNPKNLSL